MKSIILGPQQQSYKWLRQGHVDIVSMSVTLEATNLWESMILTQTGTSGLESAQLCLSSTHFGKETITIACFVI